MTARKANTPTLTCQQIVATAMEIVDRDGLDALSMRSLASALGVGTMSLYYHVRDKAALHDLILDAVMSEVNLAALDPSGHPRERIACIARAFRAALLKHPNMTPIAAGTPMRTPAQLRPVEAMLSVLLEAGLEPAEAVRAVNVIGQYVIGTATILASQMAESEDPGGQIEIDPAEFPNLLAALSGAGEIDWDADFEAGLVALVDGLVPSPVGVLVANIPSATA